jgi:hypothetical protein
MSINGEVYFSLSVFKNIFKGFYERKTVTAFSDILA